MSKTGAVKPLALGVSLFALSLPIACGPSDGQPSTASESQASSKSPYPPSTVVKTINWDFNITRLAGGPGLDGSDLWSMAWDSNGDLYGVWGDGKGVGETASTPASDKAFMGVSRFVGAPPPTELGKNPTATNVWGGVGTTNPNKYSDGSLALGKGNVYFAVKDDLGNDVQVMSVAVQDANRKFTGAVLVVYSLDEGETWTKVPNTGSFQPCGGLLFGPGSTGTPAALEGYVYGYLDQGNATGTLLCREPKSHFSKANIASLAAHTGGVQWFAGVDAKENPKWGTLAQAVGVINDTRTEDTIVTYDPPLSRYIAVYEFNRPLNGDDTPMGPVAVLDAHNPWGPWTTVAYYQSWGGSALSPAVVNLGTTILPNWLGPVNANGTQSFCAVFSGIGAYDSFNLLCNNELVLQTNQALVTIDTVSTGKAYDTTTAAAGETLFIDRNYTITSLSSSFAGGTLIRTANDDKHSTSSNLLEFTLSRTATVHVVYDDRITGAPAWLSGWTLSANDSLASTTYPNSTRIYSKTFGAGPVTLGGNAGSPVVPPVSGSFSNYVVIAK